MATSVQIQTGIVAVFQYRWTLGPKDVGRFIVGASHSSDADRTRKQGDGFTVYGLQVVADALLQGVPGQYGVSGSVQNTGDDAVSGVQLVLPAALAGWSLPAFLSELQLSISSVIGAVETTPCNVSATVAGAVVYYWFDVTITATQPIGTVQTQVTINMKAPQPQLSVSPASLVQDIVRGAQAAVSFTVSNTGGAASGPLSVVLPGGVSELTLVSSSSIASIAPDSSTTVTVLMSTQATDTLGTVSGWIAVNGAYVGRSESFAFGIVSNAMGTLRGCGG